MWRPGGQIAHALPFGDDSKRDLKGYTSLLTEHVVAYGRCMRPTIVSYGFTLIKTAKNPGSAWGFWVVAGAGFEPATFGL